MSTAHLTLASIEQLVKMLQETRDVVQEDATSMRESTSINGEMVDSYGSIAEVERLEDIVKRCDEALKPFIVTKPAKKTTRKPRA